MTSARVRGMTPMEKASIDDNISYIRKILDPRDIIWSMIEEGVVSMSDRQEIVKGNPDTTEGRCSRFLELLRKGDSKTYAAFVKSLEAKKYDELAERIRASLEQHKDRTVRYKSQIKQYRKGKLSKIHEYQVRKNLTHIVDQLDAQHILDVFVEENLVDKTGEESVRKNNPDTKTSRTEAFLELLFDMDDRAFSVLIRALRVEGYGTLADQIERTEAQQQKPEDEEQLLKSFDGMVIEDKDIPILPDEILKRQPTDLQLSRLAREIGSFKVLARELKVKDAKVQQVILDNPNDTTEQCYQILKHWRTLSSNQDGAYILDLISACKRANLDTEPSVYVRIFNFSSE